MGKVLKFTEEESWKASFPRENLFYEEPQGMIYWGNAIEVLDRFPDKSVDLVVTSPPYDTGIREYEGEVSWNFEVFKEIATRLERVIKLGGVIVWVVADRTYKGTESCTSFKQALFFKEELGLNLHDTMIYEKEFFTFPESNRYYNTFEYMFVFSKGKPKTFNPIRDRKNKHVGDLIRGTERLPDGTLRKKPGYKRRPIREYGVRHNVWRYSTGNMKTTKDRFAFEHPAMFPEKLARDHIISWSNQGDIVLDPMCGAGTTLKMAKALNRRFVGIDLVEKYCKISVKRVGTVEVGDALEEEKALLRIS